MTNAGFIRDFHRIYHMISHIFFVRAVEANRIFGEMATDYDLGDELGRGTHLSLCRKIDGPQFDGQLIN